MPMLPIPHDWASRHHLKRDRYCLLSGRTTAQMAARRGETVQKMSERLKATIQVNGMTHPSDIQAAFTDCTSWHY